MSDLKEKTVKGISWNFAEQLGLQGIRFILGIIMARLLTPADYGLIGMVTVFFAIAQVFVDSGLSLAYIQKKDVSEADSNTVFYTNLLLSSFCYAVFWIGAPHIAKFYNQPQLIEITRIMSIVLVINSFNIIQLAKLTREVNFKLKTKITLLSTLISGFLGVLSAYIGFGVWSLVIQQLASRFSITSGLWITSKWKPKLMYSTKSFKTMFSYGSWALGSGLVRTFFDNIYTLTIGKIFPVDQLGFYTKAHQLQKMVSQNLAGAVGTVSFPVFSKLQNNVEKLKATMSKFLKNTMFIVFPLMIILIVIANPFILILLTEKWAPMIPFFQLLCIIGILYPLHLVNVQALSAFGKIKQTTIIEVIKNVLRVLNLFITYRWGVFYIIIGEVLVSTLSLIINNYYIKKYINYSLLYQISDIKEIITGGVLAGIVGYIIISFLDNQWSKLFAGSIIVLAVYILIQYFFNKRFILEFIGLRKYFTNIK